MEEGLFDILMGGIVDFFGGKCWGIVFMLLLKYNLISKIFDLVELIEILEII